MAKTSWKKIYKSDLTSERLRLSAWVDLYTEIFFILIVCQVWIKVASQELLILVKKFILLHQFKFWFNFPQLNRGIEKFKKVQFGRNHKFLPGI